MVLLDVQDSLHPQITRGRLIGLSDYIEMLFESSPALNERTLSSGLNVSDPEDVYRTRYRETADVLTLIDGDLIANIREYAVLNTDNFNLQDLVSRSPERYRNLGDALAINDLLSRELTEGGNIVNRVLQSQAALTDTLLPTRELFKLLQDMLTLTDQLNVARRRDQLLGDQFDVQDLTDPLVFRLYARLLEDSVDIDDTLSIERVLQIVRTLLSSLDVYDQLQVLSASLKERSLIDTTEVSDELLTYVGRLRILLDAVDVADQVDRQGSVFRALVSSVAVEDSVAREYMLLRLLADNLTTYDGIFPDITRFISTFVNIKFNVSSAPIVYDAELAPIVMGLQRDE